MISPAHAHYVSLMYFGIYTRYECPDKKKNQTNMNTWPEGREVEMWWAQSVTSAEDMQTTLRLFTTQEELQLLLLLIFLEN